MATPTSTTTMSPPDIVLIPRTPTPPQSPTPFDPGTPIMADDKSGSTPHGRQASYGLGLNTHSTRRHSSSQSSVTYDPNSLSPVSRMKSRDSLAEDVTFSPSATYFTPTLSAGENTTNVPGSAGGAGDPFNFQPTSMSKSPVIKSVRCFTI